MNSFSINNKTDSYHPLLNKHKVIGVDIDSTLIQGPCSAYLQDWCANNYETHELHLITFRYGSDLENASIDIHANGGRMEWFKSITGAPDHQFDNFFFHYRLKRSANGNLKKLSRILAHHNITDEEIEEAARVTTMWKALRCKQLGCTALVDDLVDFVLPGCQLHGIEFIDSLKL